VVEHQDRLTRFGYIEQLLQMQDRSLEVMLPTETKSLAHDGSKP
jgi:predicted site-specific integrase-resolvase